MLKGSKSGMSAVKKVASKSGSKGGKVSTGEHTAYAAPKMPKMK